MGATVIELTSSSNVAQPGAMNIGSCRQMSDVRAARHGVGWTLIADTRKGNRPSFTDAAAPEVAEPLYEHFCEALELEGLAVARGIFGARMDVSLVNEGPVTIVLEA